MTTLKWKKNKANKEISPVIAEETGVIKLERIVMALQKVLAKHPNAVVLSDSLHSTSWIDVWDEKESLNQWFNSQLTDDLIAISNAHCPLSLQIIGHRIILRKGSSVLTI